MHHTYLYLMFYFLSVFLSIYLSSTTYTCMLPLWKQGLHVSWCLEECLAWSIYSIKLFKQKIFKHCGFKYWDTGDDYLSYFGEWWIRIRAETRVSKVLALDTEFNPASEMTVWLSTVIDPVFIKNRGIFFIMDYFDINFDF